VLNWLSNGPCRGAAEALLQEVEQHGLLPKSECCVTGTCHHASAAMVAASSDAADMKQCLGTAQGPAHINLSLPQQCRTHVKQWVPCE